MAASSLCKSRKKKKLPNFIIFTNKITRILVRDEEIGKSFSQMVKFMNNLWGSYRRQFIWTILSHEPTTDSIH